jgi:hypothetical protein
MMIVKLIMNSTFKSDGDTMGGTRTIFKLNNTIWYGSYTHRVLFEKATVDHLVTKFPPFMVAEYSLPCSQESDTDPYPEAEQSSPHPPTLFP